MAIQVLVLFLLPPAAALPEQAPRDIVRRSVELDLANLERLRQYVFQQRELHVLRVPGLPERTTRDTTFEANLVSGAMYWRLLAVNGKPVEGADAERERQRLARHLESHRRAAPADPAWIEERAFLAELPEAYEWKTSGTQTLRGRDCFVIEGKPRKKWTPASPRASVFLHQRVRLWVDRDEYHWVRQEWETLDAVDYTYRQMILGRFSLPYSAGLQNRAELKRGVRRTMDLRRLDDGTWVPVRYASRLIRRGGSLEVTVTYTDFRKFAADARLLP